MIAAGGVILAVVLYFTFFSTQSEPQGSSVEPQEVQENLESHSRDNHSEEDSLEKESSSVSEVEGVNETPLDKLLKKVNGLSMFNQKGLDELREEAYAWIEENPKEFENFTIEKVIDAEKQSIESLFFFVEVYAKKHPDPSSGIDDILKVEPKSKKQEHNHNKMGEKQKQNMAKAFALEVFFERLEKKPVGSDGVAKLEGTIRGLVEKETDLMMVRQGLLVLRNYLDYGPEQLKEMVESRGQGHDEDHAISDLLED